MTATYAGAFVIIVGFIVAIVGASWASPQPALQRPLPAIDVYSRVAYGTHDVQLMMFNLRICVELGDHASGTCGEGVSISVALLLCLYVNFQLPAMA